MKYISRGLVRAETTTLVGSPGPTLVNARTENENSSPGFTWTEKFRWRPVLTKEYRKDSFGLYDTWYFVMIPLGATGSVQVMVIWSREGTDTTFTGPGAVVRTILYT